MVIKLFQAYELWKDGEGVEFFDSSLDDSFSSCKLTRCLQVALLCVQENPLDRPSIPRIGDEWEPFPEQEGNGFAVAETEGNGFGNNEGCVEQDDGQVELEELVEDQAELGENSENSENLILSRGRRRRQPRWMREYEMGSDFGDADDVHLGRADDVAAYELWKDGKGMEIMDPSLDDTLSSCKLIKCLQIALLCVQENPIDRPSMLEVSSMLKNETAIVTIPKRPAFSVRTDEDDENRPEQLHLNICSVDDATISQVVGR
ncbi:hypothetical protein POTOM_057501 [Populus tomentosa]|uniref:Uncharacterized protein n=1 Tax=Populus tomentosa TaxID=118781 RepID=A0A8X7XSR8_POPTO|nr:hypothetical protein POTOM_057501 [Populus tomentosa]